MGSDAALDLAPGKSLRQIAETYPTPLYVYDLAEVRRRIGTLVRVFRGRLEISYAVKANPNRAVLAAIARCVRSFDVSSMGEVEQALAAGGENVTFTGPGKRDEDLSQFVTIGRGHIVLESLDEAEALSAVVVRRSLRPQPVVLRVTPHRLPGRFGGSMSGRASQFGIDEGEIEPAIDALLALPGIELVGFHCYSGTNALDAAAIAENFAIMVDLFRRCIARAGIRPQVLIFGSGFGIPYCAEDTELDLDAVAAAIGPLLDSLRSDLSCGPARLVLELGRWIVGPAGHLLTTVVRGKSSRGVEIRICDAGFNVNMAACGLLGSGLRRNWRIANLSNPDGALRRYHLVGPLCTTLDRLATDIFLPEVRKGDVLAIGFSGAYGLTASPTRFISHPEPLEIVVDGKQMQNATDARPNLRWATTEVSP